LIGTWLKTPSPIVVEVLGLTSLDLVCIDAEHAPFGRLELDQCVHAARAAGLASVVRVPTSQPHHVLQALDVGATGIVVPHVLDGEQAERIARSARFGTGGRGYAGSTRAAGYATKPMAEHKATSTDQTVVIAQIEDAEAVDRVAEIASVPGIDAVFIGTVDLSVSMGADGPGAPEVLEAVDQIIAAATSVSCPVGIFATTEQQVVAFAAKGISLFLLQSDHGFLKAGAEQIASWRTS
jgi:2-keto-3-deoxy-L-rhamnonate aldolase RhmA